VLTAFIAIYFNYRETLSRQ